MSDLMKGFREEAEHLVVMPDLDELEWRGTARRRNHRLAGVAVAAAVALVGGLAVTDTLDSFVDQSIAPATTDPEETAEEFLEAFAAFDVERVRSMTTEDAFNQIGRASCRERV